MKRENLITAFLALNVNRNRQAFKIIMDWLTGKNSTYKVSFNNDGFAVMRTCHIEGFAKTASNVDSTDEVRGLLDKLGVEYDYKKDAPRNGKTGQILIIKTKLDD